jgi:F-type H+-transporting ATPase subunit b
MVWLAAAVAAFPVAAFAGGGHGGHGSFWDLKWFLVNFALYAGLLYYFLRKPIAAGWAARRERLAAEVALRAAELQNAEAELREAELKLQSFDGEANNLRTQIARETEHEASQVTAEASKRAERTHLQTQDSLRAERRAAEGGVQKELADVVIKRAEERLKGELNVDADRILRDRALGGVKQLVQQ